MIIHCHPGLEVLISLFTPKWKCFQILIHHSEGVSMNILIQLNGGFSTSLFTPPERFFYPYSLQWRCFMFLFTTVGVFLHAYSPQWRCYFILIHCNGGVSASPNGGVFISSFTLANVFCVWRGCHIYTLILTGNCRSTWNIGKALSSMPCLSFKVLFILCFILAKLWLSYLWVSKSIRRDPTGLCCIYLLAVCTPWSKDIHGWYPKLTLL